MHLHAACAARPSTDTSPRSPAAGILLLGPPGSGKSDLLLRLLERGFELVADDQVEVDGLLASPPQALAGLLEVRGLGILRLPYRPSATLVLAVRLAAAERMPIPGRYEILDLPMVCVDPKAASAPRLVELALDAVQGRVSFVTGAFG